MIAVGSPLTFFSRSKLRWIFDGFDELVRWMIENGSSIAWIAHIYSSPEPLLFAFDQGENGSFCMQGSICFYSTFISSFHPSLLYLSCADLGRREAGQHSEENRSARPYVACLSIVLGPFHHLRPEPSARQVANGDWAAKWIM